MDSERHLRHRRAGARYSLLRCRGDGEGLPPYPEHCQDGRTHERVPATSFSRPADCTTESDVEAPAFHTHHVEPCQRLLPVPFRTSPGPISTFRRYSFSVTCSSHGSSPQNRNPISTMRCNPERQGF